MHPNTIPTQAAQRPFRRVLNRIAPVLVAATLMLPVVSAPPAAFADDAAEAVVTDPAPEVPSSDDPPAEEIAVIGSILVDGSGRVGEPLTARLDGWEPQPAPESIEWRVGGSPRFSGASYTPVGDDLGASVVATVVTVDGVAVESEPVVVAEGVLRNGAVSISGTARVGKKLTAVPAGFAEQSATPNYRWKRNGVAIAGGTAATYSVVAADRGARLSVEVVGTRHGYAPTQAALAMTATVAPGVLSAQAPKISGTFTVGKTLTAAPGAWTPGTARSYQWKRDGKAIAGATRSTYRLVAADGGKRVSVTVTGRLAGYTTLAKHSSSKTVLRKLAPATPKIAGTVKVGSTVKASAGSWKPAPVSLRYQWLRNGSAITGATRANYKITSADAGKKLTVRVTGSKRGYEAAAKTSGAKAVPRVMRASTPKISGSAVVGKTLTAKRGTWTPGVSFSYQWYRNGAAISGAKGATYRIQSADAGRRISVKVTGKRSGYATESRTSAKTAAVKRPAPPTRANPFSNGECPAWAPIKGNASSMIYHVPGGAYYSRTKAEDCFSTEAAAQRAGYRASKR